MFKTSFIQCYYQECVKENGAILLEFLLYIYSLTAQQNNQNNLLIQIWS